MRPRDRILSRLAGLAGALILTGAAWAQLPEGAKLMTAEEHTTAVLPDPSPHWVFILEPTFPHLIASVVWIMDGDTLDMVGMMNAGYTPNFAIAPDNSQLYVAETFWSRGTRGERTDVVSFFDPHTLEFEGEVPLPKGRFLVVPKKYNVDLTTDGRYLLSFNMAPATTVSVVDVQTKTYVADIETPGCALIYVMGPRRFSMICADGSMLTVDFDGSGNAKMSRGRPFFDVNNDPVYEHPAFSKSTGKAFFISYEGRVFPVDLSSSVPRIDDAWSLVRDAEKGTWWPGGWQVAAYHAKTNRLFVLMHKGTKWTHKQGGEEVWVFDAAQKQRIARVPLEHHAISTVVSQDDKPLLFTLSEAPSVSVFDATSYAHKGDIGDFGISPFVMYVTGE